MKPLKLQVGGFTCFRQDTELSFDDLSLFAIEGPTGSGKSTLLDAITYALYGQTPRLGGRGLEALLSPGLSQMYVRLEFEAGRGGTYRVTRLAERKGSNIERQVRIESLDRSARWRQLPESEKIKEAGAKLEQIVGLDYEGFTRAVLLPQGAFDEFLRGDASKRRKLLVNLLQLDRIDAMRAGAGQRAKDAETKRKSIEERLQQDYQQATPERLRELKEELKTLESRRARLQDEREALEKEFSALAEVKRLLDDLARVQEQLETLKIQEDSIQVDRQALKRARDASLIMPQVVALEDRQTKLTRLLSDLARLEAKYLALAQTAQAADVKLAQAQHEAGRVPEINAQLESLAALRPRLEQLKARGGTLALALKAKPEVIYSDTAWDKLQEYRLQLPNLEKARQEVLEAERELASAQQVMGIYEKNLAELAHTFETLKSQGLAAKAGYEKLEETYRQAVISDRAAALRSHLHLGEACPVCEQVVKTLPPPLETNLGILEKQRDEAKERLESLRDACRNVQGEQKTVSARLADVKSQQARAEEQLSRRKVALAQTEAIFAPFKTIDPARIAERLEEGRVHLLGSLAQSIQYEAKGLDPERAPAQLTRERERLQVALKEAQERQQQAQAELGRLEIERAMSAERRVELEAEVKAGEASLASALGRAQFATAGEVRAAALDEARQGSLEKRIKAYESQRALFESQEAELTQKLAGRSLDEAAYTRLSERKIELERELESVQQCQGGVKRALEQTRALLERAKELREALTRLAEVYDTYHQLSWDLRGDQFPDYLIARVQQELALRASQIVRDVTEGRYDLRLKDNDYYVLDAWHDGELRSVKTLSGGETFIASLALALALSETIAGNTVLGALFLDEGFGTLDAETLDAVASVLESLTQEGRLVGVITHVTALTERLPARLRVRKGPEGSRVSWEA